MVQYGLIRFNIRERKKKIIMNSVGGPINPGLETISKLNQINNMVISKISTKQNKNTNLIYLKITS